MIRLFTLAYDARSSARQQELTECLHRNLANAHLDQVILWWDSGAAPAAPPGLEAKLVVLKRNHVPTFTELFAVANEVCANDDIAIIANSDVWFDETAAQIEQIRPGQCFALLRWEADGRLHSTPEGQPHPDSQDAWIFRAPIPAVAADFKLGLQRNDNALAYRIWKMGLDLRNPAKTIRVHHLHASAVRTFAATKNFVPPPWLHIEATELHERGQTRLLPKTFSPKWQLRRLRAWLKQG